MKKTARIHLTEDEFSEQVAALSHKFDTVIEANTKMVVVLSAMAMVLTSGYKANGCDEKEMRSILADFVDVAITYFNSEEPRLN